MYEILQKKKLADNTFLMQLKAPAIAKKAKAGQFVILRIDEKGERIPLTLVNWDRTSITLIFLEVGHTTRQLARLKKGKMIRDVVGPLGNPSLIPQESVACFVAGGLGIAAIYPIIKAYKKAKNKIITVLGAKSNDYLFYEKELEELSDQMHICTEDGSKGTEGRVTEPFFKIMRKKVDYVITVGPLAMMREICRLSKHRAKTYASINTIMVDGLGMCGGCRLTYDGKIKFSCVDGPEFDGHLVGWDELINRSGVYRKEEKNLCRLRK